MRLNLRLVLVLMMPTCWDPSFTNYDFKIKIVNLLICFNNFACDWSWRLFRRNEYLRACRRFCSFVRSSRLVQSLLSLVHSSINLYTTNKLQKPKNTIRATLFGVEMQDFFLIPASSPKLGKLICPPLRIQNYKDRPILPHS